VTFCAAAASAAAGTASYRQPDPPPAPLAIINKMVDDGITGMDAEAVRMYLDQTVRYTAIIGQHVRELIFVKTLLNVAGGIFSLLLHSATFCPIGKNFLCVLPVCLQQPQQCKGS
jgi:hypothetical protein